MEYQIFAHGLFIVLLYQLSNQCACQYIILNFLLFFKYFFPITGSDLLVKENIFVRLFKCDAHTSNFARSPVAHTCGCILELLDNYTELAELRGEFNGILKSAVWVMDIV